MTVTETDSKVVHSRSGFIDRRELTLLQEEKLRALLGEILPQNRFYANKYAAAGIDGAAVRSLSDMARVPFTTKAELVADQDRAPPYGEILTYPLGRYSRLHQTSGTLGRPLRWLDTVESWGWIKDCWRSIYKICGLGPEERLFFPFSFGPFLGFWSAFDAAVDLGYLCLAGGGMSTAARIRFLLDNRPTGVLCTPTYALHLAEIARGDGIDLASAGVRFLIVAGEPGGSIASTRSRIEAAWGARVFDHGGLTEVGPLAVECPENPAGLHLLETECISEVIDPEKGRPVPRGETGELVLTNLGRWGSPVVRYRTGDLVRIDPAPCPCGRTFARLDGGILGRTDDMIHLRGNNIYPGAIEAVIRKFPEVAEFRIVVDQSETLSQLRIELEPVPNAPGASVADLVAKAVRDELLFRAETVALAPGSLPRFEMKARRIVFHKK
jgi:phenylacetate-CoA ligase